MAVRDISILEGWSDLEIDDYLHIDTREVDEWPDMPHINYNRNEPTDYPVLMRLVQAYRPRPGTAMVDFGAGRGRAMVFLHYFWQIPAVGVEYNPKVMEKLEQNLAAYRSAFPEDSGPLEATYCQAEGYQVRDEDSLFYFFNPFGIQIFRQVMAHILESYQVCPRPMDLICYYGVEEYRYYLNRRTPFHLVDRMDMPEILTDHNERLMIYHLD